MYKTIRVLCDWKNITIRELEKACGLGKNTIWKWDKHDPSVWKVKRVAEYFELTVDSLLWLKTFLGND